MHVSYINILIFNFVMSSTCFKPYDSSSGRLLYIQLQYDNCGDTHMPRIVSVETAPFLSQYIQQATPTNSAN
jgi:hypothetical protein